MPSKPAARPRACPLCGQPRADEFKPFCSRGCRDRDLLLVDQRGTGRSGTLHCDLHADADTATAGGPDPSPDTPPRTPTPEELRAALPESDPLAPLVRALASGDSIVIFPEGTRGHGDEPQSFKSGLFKLAQMFPQVVLVPAWINNVQRVMPKGEVVPVPILCSVTFGAPVQLEAGEERRPFLDRARRAVIALREV